MKSYVLARKGVLASDPSVRAMTEVQWAFEYLGLREREDAERRERVDLIKLVRVLAIKLLGLDLLNGAENVHNPPENTDDLKYMPLAMLVGHPRMVSQIAEEFDKYDKTARAMEDDGFDALSNAIATGDTADMDPIFSNITPEVKDPVESYLEKYGAELRSAGVQLTNGKLPEAAHITVTTGNSQAARRARLEEQARIRREMEALKDLSNGGQDPS